MSRKIVFLSLFLGVILLCSSCSLLEKNQTEKEQKQLTIFTPDILLGIHAKMITGDNGKVTIATNQKLSPDELLLLQHSNIVLETTTISESKFSNELQNYKGLYVNIESFADEQIMFPTSYIYRQIELIRNTLSEADPYHRGYYYDNAGGYVHLLEEMNKRLAGRINEYHHTPFITIWGNFDTFIEIFGLAKYHVKHYNTLKDFIEEKGVKDFLRSKGIKNVFIHTPLRDYEIRDLEKKYQVVVYNLPFLKEDTSGWGYLRHVEKIMNDFVRAFDTYD